VGRNQKPLSEIDPKNFRMSRHGERLREAMLKTANVGFLIPPEDMTEAAKKIWNELLPTIPSLKASDIQAFTELCETRAEFRRLFRMLPDLSPGSEEYDAVQEQAAKLEKILYKLSAKFGLTPADRQRLIVQPGETLPVKSPTRPKTKLDSMGPPATLPFVKPDGLDGSEAAGQS
jgi:phage terminase small subunit